MENWLKTNSTIKAKSLSIAFELDTSMSEIKITVHAKTRMARYEISEELVRATIQHADNIVNGYKGRTVFQKRLNDHL